MKRILALALLALLALAFEPFAKDKHEGPHVLTAKGSHGWIKFSASGPGSARVAGKGSLTIENVSQQQLKVEGTWGEKSSLPDGVKYTHFEGSVEAVGIGVQMELRGWNLGVQRQGTGRQGQVSGRGNGQAGRRTRTALAGCRQQYSQLA